MTYFKLLQKVKCTLLCTSSVVFFFLFSFSYSTYAQAPTIQSISPQSVCSDATITIVGANFTGVTNVKITNGADLSFNIVSSSQITAVMPSTIPQNSFTIEVTNDNGSVTSASLSKFTGTVTGPTTLKAPTVTGALTVCEDQPLNLTIEDPDNNTGLVFSWTFSTTSNIRGASNGQASTISDIILIDDEESTAMVTYSIVSKFTSSCGVVITSPVKTISVTVNTRSKVALPQTPTVCGNENLSISFNVIPQTGLPTWMLKEAVAGITLSENSGTGNVSITVTNTSGTNKSFILVVTPPAGQGGCQGKAEDLTVIVRPPYTPTILKKPVITGDLSLCSGSNLDLSISDPDNTPDLAFSWTAIGNDISGISTIGNGTSIKDNLTYTGSNGKGTVVYTITSTLANPCVGLDDTISTTISVDVYELPTVTPPTITGSICSGNNISITFTTSTNASVNWRLKTPVTNITLVNTTGTGNINETVTNTGTQKESIVFVITPKNGSCIGSEIETTVEIDPPYTPPILKPPVVSNVMGDAISICTGETLNLDISDPDGLANVVFSWTGTSSDVNGMSTLKNNDKIDDTLTYTGSGSSAIVTYVATSTLVNPCDGSSQTKTRTITVTVNEKPSISAPTEEIIVCSNSNLNIAFNSTNTTEINWRLKNSVTGLTLGGNTGSGDVSTSVLFTGATNTSFTIVATPNNGGCTANEIEVNVKLLAPITLKPATVTGLISVCSGSKLDVKLSDSEQPTAVFSWTTTSPANLTGYSRGSGNSINDTLFLTGSQQSISVEYTVVSILQNPCGGDNLTAFRRVLVQVIRSPSVMIPAGKIIVASGNLLSVVFTTSPTAAYVSWKLKEQVSGISLTNDMGTGNLSETVTNTNSVDTDFVILVIPNIGGCEGSVVEKTVTVSAPLTGPILNEPTIVGKKTICSGTALNLSLEDPNNNDDVTFSWTAMSSTVTGFSTSGNTNIITDALVYTGTTQGSVVYSITASLTNGSNTQTKMVNTTVIINPLPTITVPDTITVCSGENVSVTFNPAINVEINWKLKQTIPELIFFPNMGTSNINQVVTNNSNTSKQMIFEITPTNTITNCSGDSKEVKVNVIPPLQEPIVTGSTQVCDGDPLALQISDINTETTFSWTVIQSKNVSGAKASNGKNINDTLTLAQGFSSGSVKYKITSVLNSVCANQQTSNKEIEVLVKSKPMISNVPAKILICSGNTIPVSLSGSLGSTVEWKVERGNPKINLDTTSGIGSINLTYFATQQLTNIESIIFSARAVDSSSSICSTGDYISFVVQIVPSIRRPDVTGSLQVCNNTRTNLLISSPTDNTNVQYSWTVKNTISVDGANSMQNGTIITDQLVRTSDTGTASVTYRIVPFIEHCTGVPREITVNVINPPNVSFLQTSLTSVVNGEANICVNDAINIGFTSNESSGISFNWMVTSKSSSITGIKTSGTTNVISESSVSHTVSISQTITYSIVSSNLGCPGTPVSLKVYVHPQASIGFLKFSDTVCSGEQLSFSAGVLNGLQNWAIKIEPTPVAGSTVTGQNQNDNFTGTVGDVLVNSSTESQKVKYKVTAIAPNSACSNVVLEKEVTVLPQANFAFASPNKACAGDKVFPLRLSNLVNVNASTLKWTNTDPFLVGEDPKIKKDINNEYYYDVSSDEASPSITIRLRATASTIQGSCNDVVKDFSFTIESIPQMTLASYDENTLLSNKSEKFRLQLLGGVNANTTFSVDKSETYANGFFIPTALTEETTVKVTATYTNPTTNCKTTKDFLIKVFKVPDAFITNTKLNFCADDSTTPPLVGSPLVGETASNGKVISSAFWSGQGIINPTQATLNISALTVGKNSITYNIADSNNIENSKSIDFIVNPLPQSANFTVQFTCESSVQFRDNTGFVAGENDIVAWNWNFGDQTTSTLKIPPIHTFATAGTYDVSLLVSTAHGCQSITRRSVVIPPFITPNFEWSGLCENSQIQFSDKSINTPDNTIYKWEFGDGNTVSGSNSNDLFKNPKHTYTSSGQYIVTLSVGNQNCVIKKTHTLTVHNTFTPTVNNAYIESFEQGDGGWVPGYLQDGKSTWEHGVPTASVINNTANGARVWTTNKEGEYAEDEKSWLTSPCFNLNSLTVPELSFYIFLHTPEKVAGSTFEISYDRGISWQLFGSITTKNAFNWFDKNAIAGNLYSVNPNSNLGREGWSGEFTNWKHVIFDLEAEFRDRSVEDKQIVLRLIFASPQGQPVRGYNGVAIDNVIVENKKEKILVENLINLNNVEDRQSELSFSSTYSEFINKLVQVSYHINSIGNDVFNLDNPVPAATRRFYYELASGKNMMINGKIINTAESSVQQVKNELITAGFKKQKMKMTAIISQNPNSNVFDIKANLQVSENKDYNLYKEGHTLHCVVTQPRILGLPGTVVNSDENVYYNVMKEMLPNAGGTDLILDTTNGNFNTVNLKYFPKNIYNEKNIEIILFVQNKETKQIELVDKFLYKNVENTDFTALAVYKNKHLENINVYPVPFVDELKISIPPELNESNSLNIQLVNNEGKHFYLPLRRFKSNVVVNTSALSKGVYTLYVFGDNINYFKKIIKSE